MILLTMAKTSLMAQGRMRTQDFFPFEFILLYKGLPQLCNIGLLYGKLVVFVTHHMNNGLSSSNK